jgi:hypothetical protein
MLAVKSKGSVFEATYRKLVVRLGHKKAIWAIAHRLCRLTWKILHQGVPEPALWRAALASAGRVPAPRRVPGTRPSRDTAVALTTIMVVWPLPPFVTVPVCGGLVFPASVGGECDRAFDNSITGFSVPALVLALSPACSSVLLLRLRQNPAHVLQSQLGVLIDEVQPYRLPVHHRQRMAQFKARIAVIPDIE